MDGCETALAPVHVDALLTRMKDLAPGNPRRVALRCRAIGWYPSIAVYPGAPFAGRDEPQADLTQVAVVGLTWT